MDEKAIALHDAIELGDVPAMRSLIRRCALSHYSSLNYGTPVYSAVAANQPEALQFLLNINADTASRGNDESPLSLAILQMHTECARILIQSGKCDLDRVDPATRNPPICDAAALNMTDIVKWLVEAGCDVNKPGKRGSTALHLAVTKQSLEAVEILLDVPARMVNVYDHDGNAPIHLAAACFNTAILETFLVKCPGMALNIASQKNGDTPLHIAFRNSNDGSIGLLLDTGCDVNVQNDSGETPLYVACHTPIIDYVIALLHSGADPNIICKPRPHESMGKRDISCAHVAVSLNNYILMVRLTNSGANLNVQNYRGHTPLHISLIQNRPHIAHYLLQLAQKSDRVIVNGMDAAHETALFFIPFCEDFISRLVNGLVKLGCDVNHANAAGKRALHVAMALDNHEVVRVLLLNGADANAVHDGRTPLQACAFEDQEDIALELIVHGADMQHVADDGETALRIALENNSLGVVKLLLGCGYNVSREGFSEDAIDSASLPFYLRDESHVLLRHLIFSHARQPTKLIIQCRTYLREYMRDCQLPFARLKRLRLPKRLLDFLLLKVI